jgi:ABC-2 type transport system permease protein
VPSLRFNPFYQLTLVKIREFLREPEAVFWVFVFPVVLALALGIAFRSGDAGPVVVGVQQGPGADWAQGVLEATDGVESKIVGVGEAGELLRQGKLALVVIAEDPWTYWFDPTRPESRLAHLTIDDVLQEAAGRRDARAVELRRVEEKGSRYIDFLIPGLLGMNLMGTGMWGIGFYIVKARSTRLLKRLVATPMRRSHFLLSQISGRLVFLILEVTVILLFAHWAFGVPVRGSLATLALVCVLGSLTFGGLGLLVASRAQTTVGVSGLMNFAMVPMWIGSGTFFSTARFPDAMQPFVQALPLTAVNDALRAVMLEGASPVDLAGELAIMAVWALVSFAIALRIFRWN